MDENGFSLSPPSQNGRAQRAAVAPLPGAGHAASLACKLDQFEASRHIVCSTDALFRDASWFAVMMGQGVTPQDTNPLIDGMEESRRHLEAVRSLIRKTCDSLPGLTPR